MLRFAEAGGELPIMSLPPIPVCPQPKDWELHKGPARDSEAENDGESIRTRPWAGVQGVELCPSPGSPDWGC